MSNAVVCNQCGQAYGYVPAQCVVCGNGHSAGGNPYLGAGPGLVQIGGGLSLAPVSVQDPMNLYQRKIMAIVREMSQKIEDDVRRNPNSPRHYMNKIYDETLPRIQEIKNNLELSIKLQNKSKLSEYGYEYEMMTDLKNISNYDESQYRSFYSMIFSTLFYPVMAFQRYGHRLADQTPTASMAPANQALPGVAQLRSLMGR